MRLITLVLALFVTFNASAQKINRIIKEKRVRSVLKTLSADQMAGRAVFTPGADKAAQFIAEEFKKTGLQTLEGSDSYLQSFEMLSAETKSVAVTINGQPVDPKDLLVFGATEQINWNNSGAEKIYIKAGENFGQKLFALAQETRNTLVIADTSFRRSINRFRSFKLQRFKGAGNIVVALNPGDAEYYTVQANINLKISNLANVVGVLPGKSLKNEYVVFSGHYDHLGIGKPVDNDSIFNGANDDASGTTAVIMLSRYFKKIKNNERTIIFVAFTGEESGGYGSRYFSSQLDPSKVQAMFNIEMIGTESKWGKNSAYITGYEKTDFGKLVQANLEGSGFNFQPDPYPEQQLFFRSDNATLAKLGVPAHTISTSKMDSEKYYHTVNDEIETLDLKNMTEIIKSIAISSKGIVEGTQTPTRVRN